MEITNSSLNKELKDLATRNRRQEDFIFTMQAKLDQEKKEKLELQNTIDSMLQKRDQPEDIRRDFGSQTQPVKMHSVGI